MTKAASTNERGAAMYELSGSELDAVAGGAGPLGLLDIQIRGESALSVASHWKEGILVEQVSEYQSVSSGSFSLGI